MEIRHSVCALDCPDACALLVHIEDGRATRLRGDPDHPVTRGFLCGKVAQYLEREYSPDRLLYPQKRTGAKGQGRFTRISWDEALDTIAQPPGRHRAGVRTRIDSALQLRRHHGPAQQRRHGPPLLPSPGRLAPRPHHLLLAPAAAALNATLGLRYATEPEQFRRLEAHHRLGREYSRHQRAPVALHRRSPPQGSQAGRDRPRQDPHRRAGRPLSRHQSRQRSGAGAGPDPRDHGRKPVTTPITSRATPTASTNSRNWRVATIRREWPRSPASRPKTSSNLRASTPGTRPAVIRLNYGVQRSERGGAAVRAITALPALTGSWKEVGGGLQLSTSHAFQFNTSRSRNAGVAGPLGPRPRSAHRQYGGAGQGAHGTRRRRR